MGRGAARRRVPFLRGRTWPTPAKCSTRPPDHHGGRRNRHRRSRHQVVQDSRAPKSGRGPFKSFKDRTVMVTMSPSSVEVAAQATGCRTCASAKATGATQSPKSTSTAKTSRNCMAGRRRRSSSPTSCCASTTRRGSWNIPTAISPRCSRPSPTITNSAASISRICRPTGPMSAWARPRKPPAAPTRPTRIIIGGNMIGTPEQLVEHHLDPQGAGRRL